MDLRWRRRRLGCSWSLRGARRNNRRSRRLDHGDALRRHNCHSGTRGCCRGGRSLGNHRSDRGLGGYGRRRRRHGDNLRRLPDRRHNLARLGTRGSGRRMRHCHNRRRGLGRGLRLRGRRRPDGNVASACSRFIFLLFGQNRLERIARLGDMREVNLRLYRLRSPGCGRVLRWPCAALEIRAHPFGFVCLQRAGVGLAFPKAELR
jgi:hypothetical protein